MWKAWLRGEICFAPEKIFLNLKMNFLSVFLACGLAFGSMQTVVPATAGMFGISIPSNYGNWFVNIQKWILSVQKTIAQARKLYTVYVSVSGAVDALRGLSETGKQNFIREWREVAVTLLGANIAFELDQSFYDGETGSQELLSSILGLTVNDEGRITIDPGRMQMFGLAIGLDDDYWREIFLDSKMPLFPSGFYTRSTYTRLGREFLHNQAGVAFRNFGNELNDAFTESIRNQILRNPLIYLACERNPCYSPFSADGNHTYSWEEILANMYQRDLPLHNPNPLAEELTGGAFVEDFDAFLHRRVSSAVWLAMGRKFEKLLIKTENSFAKRCNEILSAVHKVENLINLVQSITFGLESFQSLQSRNIAGNVTQFALGLDLDGDGTANDVGRNQNLIDGFYSKKLSSMSERALQVKAKLKDLGAIIQDLRAQVQSAKRKRSRRHPSLKPAHLIVADAIREATLPSGGLGGSDTRDRLNGRIAQYFRTKR